MENPVTNFDYSSLIPDGIFKTIIGPYARDRVAFASLGSGNLQYFLRCWRAKERTTTDMIKDCDKRISDLVNFQQIAIRGASPVFEKIETMSDSKGIKKPAGPVELFLLKHGVGTFNICGFCKYCFGGYDCDCNNCLVADPDAGGLGCGMMGDIEYTIPTFDTPCLLAKDPELLGRCLSDLELGLEKLKSEKSEFAKRARTINSILKEIEKDTSGNGYKPSFPGISRDYEKGAQVVCYVIPTDLHNYERHEGTFVRGRVVDTRRLMVYVEPKIGEDTGYCAGHGLRFTASSLPYLMSEATYKRLQENDSYSDLWFKVAAARDDMFWTRENTFERMLKAFFASNLF